MGLQHLHHSISIECSCSRWNVLMSYSCQCQNERDMLHMYWVGVTNGQFGLVLTILFYKLAKLAVFSQYVLVLWCPSYIYHLVNL